MNKRVYFLAGLPRSGSTLLANILAQHGQIHVTPTSGIVDMLVQVRNAWDRNDAFQAADRKWTKPPRNGCCAPCCKPISRHTDRPICIDKNRYWAEYLEMAAALVGGRDHLKVIVTVRDLRDVLASFELLYRKTSAFGEFKPILRWLSNSVPRQDGWRHFSMWCNRSADPTLQFATQ